ncbi:MAG: type II secretion system F family protein [Geminicoccaceae bacterium]
MTSVGFTLIMVLALLPLSVALFLTDRKTERHLRERLEEAAMRGRGGVAAVAPVMPSIRAVGHDDKPLVQRLVQMLGINRDLPEERILAWPVVTVLSVLAGFLVWLIASIYVGPLLGLPISIVGGFACARAIFHWQHQRYCTALFKQVPDALGMVLRSVRAGLPVSEALRGVANEMSAPTGPQFARICGEIAIGNSIESAFLRLYQRTQVAEYGFLSVTLGLQSQSGGSLGETLEILADIVRKRVTIAARAKALSAEATSSALILIVLPFLCAGAMSAIRPGYLGIFWSDPRGFKMLVIGLTLMVLGAISIYYLITQATAE